MKGRAFPGPSSHWADGAKNAVRPALEATLLAALALGCAQAGWGALAPQNASAVDDATASDRTPTSRLELLKIDSPFAPAAEAGATHAASALLSGIELDGVRMSITPERSGAVLSVAGAAQQAFLVGQELTDGIVLEAVARDHVVLAHAGGKHIVRLEAVATTSFSRALMGLDAPPPALAMDQSTPAAAHGEAPSVEAPNGEATWIAQALANVEKVGGQAIGWRVPEPAPQAALRAGLRGGDLIVSVDGAGPDRALPVLAASRNASVVIDVRRGVEQLRLTVALGDLS